MRITANFDGMNHLLDALGRHASEIPYATELAINATARATKRATEIAMRHDFDRPTPFVMAGLFIDNAKYRKNKLWAEVHVKDKALGIGTHSLAEKIGQQFSGGTGRLRGRMERAFERDGYITAGEYLIPGPDAQRDRYGNLSGAQINRIYAALRIFSDAAQNATSSRRSRRNTRAAGHLFWSNGPGHDTGHGIRLRRGLWGTNAQGGLRLVLVVAPKVSYRRRIELDRLAEITVARDFRRNFERAMQQAIATAR